jgi:hypothetical protein
VGVVGPPGVLAGHPGKTTLTLVNVPGGSGTASAEDPGQLAALARAALLLAPGRRAEAEALMGQAITVGRAERKRPRAAAAALDAAGQAGYDHRRLDQAHVLWTAALAIQEKLAPNKMALSFTPDGEALVSGRMDGTIRLWRSATFAETDAPAGAHRSRSSR